MLLEAGIVVTLLKRDGVTGKGEPEGLVGRCVIFYISN